MLALLTRLRVTVRTSLDCTNSPLAHILPPLHIPASTLPMHTGKHSHLLTLDTKPRAGCATERATTARLAKVVTARRANMLGGYSYVLCSQYC